MNQAARSRTAGPVATTAIGSSLVTSVRYGVRHLGGHNGASQGSLGGELMAGPVRQPGRRTMHRRAHAASAKGAKVETEVRYGPSFALATVRMAPGETIKAEAGAMVAMSSTVEIQTDTQGGFMKGLRRSVLGGESFFMNTFTANGPGAEIALAPSLPGDIVEWPLQGQTVFLQSGSYLASSTDVTVDSQWGGAKTFFSREGLFMLKVGGVGKVLVASYGAIHAVDLAPGQTYTVDTGHMVAWSESVRYEVRKVGNWKSTLLGGEGLIVSLTGPGRIYVQTRSPEALVAWLIPQLPKSNS